MPGNLTLINREELLKRCLEDTAFMHQMLRVFQDSAPTLVQELHQSVAAGKWADAKRHAHTLKGTASNLAIADLRALSIRAEERANASDTAGMSEVLPLIDATLEGALAEAEALLRA